MVYNRGRGKDEAGPCAESGRRFIQGDGAYKFMRCFCSGMFPLARRVEGI